MKLESSSIGIFIKHIKNGEYTFNNYLDQNNEIPVGDLYNLYIEFHNENKLFQCYKMCVKVQFKEQFQKLYTSENDVVYLIQKKEGYFRFKKNDNDNNEEEYNENCEYKDKIEDK